MPVGERVSFNATTHEIFKANSFTPTPVINIPLFYQMFQKSCIERATCFSYNA
jgi:hypothetical protein